MPVTGQKQIQDSARFADMSLPFDTDIFFWEIQTQQPFYGHYVGFAAITQV